MNREIAAVLVLVTFLAAPAASTGQDVRVVDRPDTSVAGTLYVGNRPPLQPAPLIKLPIGAIKPSGWLGRQLELMRDGQVGHLPELSGFLKSNSGWLGGRERGWEEAAYWFRGFYDLARLTGEKRLLKIADRWIEAVIGSRDADGYYGSPYNKAVRSKKGDRVIADVWPHMVMNDALISHYEATGDKRVIPMLGRFFAFCRDLPDEQFLPLGSWDHYETYKEHFGDWKPRIQLKRAGDLVPQILWLYNRTGEKWLIDLAVRVYHRTQPAMNQWLDNHVVHFMQRFRYPAQMYPITGDVRYLAKTELFYRQMLDTWGQMPRGVFAADERIRSGKIDPRQGFETCAMVEANKSHYILGRITGDTAYADRVEDMTFNHLPASHAPDHRSLRYLTACNMPTSVPRMDFKNGGDHPVFKADGHRCCQHNTAMGWPSFAKNLWQASPDNGLVAWLYGPASVEAKVGEAAQTVQIVSETVYPFSGQIDMKLAADKPVDFPLYLRIPGWCDELTVGVNGRTQRITGEAGRYARIARTWRDGDSVSLNLAMGISVTQWPRNGSVTIDRGPLSYSVRIKEQWNRQRGGAKGWPRWTLTPGSPWNYGLCIDVNDPGKSVRVVEADTVRPQPWSEPGAPVVLKVPARRIAGWGTGFRNTVDAVREGPVRSDEKLELIEMIPMGCAHLRMTCLPLISGRRDARFWADIPDPGRFMYDKLDRAAARKAKPARLAKAPAGGPVVAKGPGLRASASTCGRNDTVRALFDGVVPDKSADKQTPRMTWWPRTGTREWVQYDFERPRKLSRTEVYWFDDTGAGKCRVPKSWRVEWKDAGTWKPVTGAGAYGLKRDAFNAVEFDEVTTRAVRLVVQLRPEFSGGIHEWRVGGAPAGGAS